MKKIAGVLLAAGGSTRFGRPKQLLDWNGVPLVTHVLDTAAAAGLEPLTVVLGCEAQAVQSALQGRSFRPVMNWRWEQGLSTSVQAGLSALPPDVDGAVLLLCDQPLLTADLLRQLVARFRESEAPIVHPVHNDQQRTPVLFARSLFAEVSSVTGDQGGRDVIARHADEATIVEVEDPHTLADIDTPDDYQRLLQIQGTQEPSLNLRGIRHLIVDMDGVLWREEQPLPGLQELFAFIQERDIRYTLATNNASKRPEQYVDKLASMGVQVTSESIATSAQATAAYLADQEPDGAPVYVIGLEGLRHCLKEHGFELTEEGARYVVVGWDPDLTWNTLAEATLLIRAGAEFIGTNPDRTFPGERGILPGNGAQLAALQAATGVEPTIIGKPHPWLYREAMRRMGAKPDTTAVVGDRIDTDIAGGERMAILTVLLLSGVSQEKDLEGSTVRPDLVYAHLREFVEAWREVIDT